MKIRPKVLLASSLTLVILYILGGLLLALQLERIVTENTNKDLENLVVNTSRSVDFAISSTIEAYLRSVAERNREIIDALYQQVLDGAATEEETFNEIADIFASQVIGDTGYLYALSGDGVIRIHPSESLIGENVSDDFDFVRRQIQMEDGYLEYMWKNPGDAFERPKALYQTTYPALDLIISASSYREEFMELISIEYLEDNISSISIGETNGHVAIIDGTGRSLIHRNYPRGTDVRNIANSKDERILNDMIEMKSGHLLYMWQDGEATEEKLQVSAFSTIESSGWLVVATVCIEEILEPWTVIDTALIVFFIVSALVFSFVLFFMLSPVVKPIGNLTKILSRIAEGDGDLTQRIHVKSRDEIRKTADLFNRFIENLSHIVLSIKNTSGALNSTKVELANTVSESLTSMQHITSTVDEISVNSSKQSEIVSEASAGVEEINSNIESLNVAIMEQVATITESSSSIEEMIANIHKVTSTVDKLSEKFSHLGEASSEGRNRIAEVNRLVDEVSSKSKGLLETNTVITDIASQTNLLAMNAAIEAAHAGDAGRGFAVVASEIRKLAENAAVQSKQIEALLKPIIATITSVVQSSDFANKSFQEIVSQIESVEQLQAEIQQAMTEQSAGGSVILEALQRMQEISASVSTGSEEMQAGSGEILKKISDLNSINTVVDNSIVSISKAMEQINRIFDGVGDVADQTSKLVENLNRETDQFTV